MKKLLFILLTLVAFAQTSCEKSTVAPDVPECIKANIEANRDKEDWYVGNVEEYLFQGKLVYAFNSDSKIIADGDTKVLTSDCVVLCSVGGFGGTSINLCNGTNFFQEAVLVRTIWNKY
jgi:hypothetical protein